MSRPPMGLPAQRAASLGVGLLSLAGWVGCLLLAPVQALRGWHIGFVYVTSLSVGAMTLVLIQRLVGGRWKPAFAPELVSAARATPLLILFMAPVVLGAGLIFPWAGAGAGAVGGELSPLKPDVRRLFLDVPLFDLRTGVAVLGWSLIAWLLPRIEGPRGRLGAALGLALHGLLVSVLAVDWLLSVQPPWTSSDIGMEFAVQQIALGAAFAGLQLRARVDDAAAGDMGGLLFAAVIGLVYLEFMAFLVVWYGDKPSLDAWYLSRASWPWQVLSWIALAFALLAVVLMAARRRWGAARTLIWVGGCVMAGVLAFQLWQLAPSLGAGCLAPAALGLVAQGGLWLALAMGGAPGWPSREPLPHGA